MAERFLGILRHERLEFCLRALMLEEGLAGIAKESRELRPRIRRAHVGHAGGGDPGPGRFDAEQARCLAALDAPPEFLLGSQK